MDALKDGESNAGYFQIREKTVKSVMSLKLFDHEKK